MSIYATLHTTPTNSGPVHEMIYITRGASAELIYPLYDKVFRAKDIDQVTFTFKQGKSLYWYSMFTYVVPSEDTTVQPKKQYYTMVKDSVIPFPCTIAEVKNPTGNPKELNYFEASTDTKLNWKTAKHAVDPHFFLFDSEDYPTIMFNFDGEDTKQFKPGITVDYEVAIRLNTESYVSLNNKDSIIIEPQHPLAIVDSLYSRV